MTKLQQAFSKKAFIPFVNAGDPDSATTIKLVEAIAEAGADVIQFGIPFSDPTAEGPVIQASSLRALQHQQTTDEIFSDLAKIRESVKTPIIITTYANIVYSYGIAKFFQKMQELDLDGLLLPDVPLEEKAEFEVEADKHGVAFISMIAPTTKDRILAIAKAAKGFIYVVSGLTITEKRPEIVSDVKEIMALVKSVTSTPAAVGIGISSTQEAQEMAAVADGIVIGSMLVKLIEAFGTDATAAVAALVKEIKAAIS